ncbi:MAG TPA: SUMF1/EgtB/PvdO family nonheme iron enzyme [Polyangiaceae bacterium]|nr:SUMF1/EgtB/PvdO family nonheme iron enzyme [Polyangiaceae bacterium]
MRVTSFAPIALVVFASVAGSCQAYDPPRDSLSDPLTAAPEEEPDASLTSADLLSGQSLGSPAAETEQVEREPVAPAAEQQPAQADDSPAASGACPSDMVLVEGKHCTVVDQPCVTWMEDPAKFPYARCSEFSREPVCKGERVAMRYCMDKLEAAGPDGIPIGDISWTNASAECKARGKRLCKEREWLFACEGEEMRPYPYGFVRDASLCNFEKEDLVDKGELRDQRQPVTSNPKCLSPFGVQNMVGNIDEWVALDKTYWTNDGCKMNSGLKGGWWGPLRNRCRPVTLDHDEYFHELQTGFRCCADAK